MFYQAKGALHMHTLHSDGTGTVHNVIQAAQEAGLEWIWITDHDNRDGRNWHGLHEGIVTLIGYEITPARNHYLVGGLDEIVARDLPPANFVAEVARRGGVGIIAHPDERVQNSVKEIYRWDDWTIRGFTGIELWNYMSDWAEHYDKPSKFVNFFMPELALRGPTKNTLAWWDALQCENHPATGLFGVDVHAFKVQQMGRTWEVFPYLHCFRTLVNYLQLDAPLSKEVATAEEQIWGAIRQGRVIMAHEGRGDAAGTTFLAIPKGEETLYTCGDNVPLTPSLMLDFLCPAPADLRLYHNGNKISQLSRSRQLRHAITAPGHYRVEAHKRGVWIMTNHIHVTSIL